MSKWVHRFTEFLAELKRRGVYQAGVGYAVGAFVVWQVVEIVAPALGWPDSVLTAVVVIGVAAAPVVLSLAWLFDLRREKEPSRALEPSDAAGSEASEQRKSRRLRTLAVVGPAGLLGLVLVWVLWPQPGRGLTDFRDGDRTLISECDNSTGDPNLDGVLNTALAANLRQSEFVAIFSLTEARTFATGFLQRPPPVRIDAETAREISVRMGFKVVIHCAIHRVGNGYVLASSIQDPGTQQDLATLTEPAGSPDEIMNAVDALGNSLREVLGESLETLAESKPLRLVSTPSLEALTVYTQASQAWERGDYGQARDLWQQALSRDSLFAAAHSGLGNYYYWFNQAPLGEEHYQKALSRPDRVAARDRLWIEANWAAYRGEQERVFGLYKAYLELWPEDAAVWYNLGNQYMRQGNCGEAGKAYSASLELNPSYAAAHSNLGVCLAQAGKADSAVHQFERAFAIRPGMKDDPNTNHDFGMVLVEVGRTEDAEELFRGQLDSSPEHRARGYRSLGLLRVRQGRYEEARAFLEEAARGQEALGYALSEYRDRNFLAGVLRAIGDTAAASSQVERMLALKDQVYLSPAWLLRVFLHLTEGSRSGRAELIRDQARADTLVSTGLDRAAIRAMDATLMALDGETPRAAEEARIAWRMNNGELLSLAVCPLAVQAREWAFALEVCEALAARVRLWEGTETGILAHSWIARIQEEQGNEEEARMWYERFLDFWGAADEGLRFRDFDNTLYDPVGEARARLGAPTARVTGSA
jgi:tetratricopeptide (TPR) repeat protein